MILHLQLLTPFQFLSSAQVYSSLTEQREPVAAHATYRPPIGSFLQSNPALPGQAPLQPLLGSYGLQRVAKDGRPALSNSSRYNNFFFHHPPVIVVSFVAEKS